jgi:3-methyladenine DNA glycosylase AlkD
VNSPSATERLVAALERHADPSKRAWWERYVKGAQFLGVPMASTRSVALDWWKSVDTDDPVGDCLDLGTHPVTEVKLAGVAVMERILVPTGAMDARHLRSVRRTIDAGGYDDWNACDWLCVKVLGPIAASSAAADQRAVLDWTEGSVTWTKRAGLVSFVNLVSEPPAWDGFDEAFLTAAATNAADGRRFVQTSVGWTLRELSHRAPELVTEFLEEHWQRMSRESLDNATKALPPDVRGSLRSRAPSP